MKTDPRNRSTRLILILALTAAIVSPLDLINHSEVQLQTAHTVVVTDYTVIPEKFTFAGLQTMPQVRGYGEFYQTQQKQVSNGLCMEVSTEAPTPANTATPTPNETQGTITFLAVSAATLILATIAFAWILKRTKKPSQKRARLTTHA